jgi:hypothetical protein
MTIETALYPNQLNSTLPPQSDIVREGAGHLRLIKTVFRTTFPNVTGAITASQTELNYSVGVTSGIQAQINTKGAITGQTWTGTHTFNGTNVLSAATTIGAVTPTEITYLSGVTSGIQTQFSAKASLNGATYTGAHDYSGATAVTLPAATSIGSLTSTELAYVDGVTAPIQGQLDGKADITGESYTGAHDFTGGTLKAPTLTTGTATTDVATTAFVASTALSAALPGQTGNAGKFTTTDGTNASWSFPVLVPTVITTNTTAVAGNYYILAAACTLTMPASKTAKDAIGFGASRGVTGAVVNFGSDKVKGRTAGTVTLSTQNDSAIVIWSGNTTDGWVQHG